jgi:putative resolvase
MKLKNWAETQGISYITAWRWCRDNRMPCTWERTPSGTIIVHPNAVGAQKKLKTYTYCRVSSYPKKDDLLRQQVRCRNFCESNGWVIDKEFKEIASGMNDNRKQLNSLFNNDPGRLVVEHKDRLTRFGFNYIENLLTKLGWELIVINRDENDKDDLMKDLIAVITSFCCRLYGLRRGYKKSKEVQEQCVAR